MCQSIGSPCSCRRLPSSCTSATATADQWPAQVPEYLEKQDALKAAGVDAVIVFCVNDGAVMHGWEIDQGIKRGSSGRPFW